MAQDKTTTAQAFNTMVMARAGTLANNGKPMTVANLPYLYEMRRHILEWADKVNDEIARIERQAQANQEEV